MKQHSTGSHSARTFQRKGNQQAHAKSAIRPWRPLLVIILLVMFGLGLATSSSNLRLASAALQAQGGVQISESAARQIQALLDEKESRTPAQQKLDSQLIYATKTSRGQAIANGVPTLETSVNVDADKATIVDISINDKMVNAQKIAHSKLEQLKIEVLSAVGNSIRARVKLEDLETVAAFPEVRFVMPKQEAKTQRAENPNPGFASAISPWLLPSLKPSFAERAARVRAQVLAALQSQDLKVGSPNAPNVVNVSEGDTTHKAALARSTFSINGTGVKVGVLSDGVSNLAAAQATGDIGPVTVLPGQTGSGDEGTAMLELVHDLAPGAQLFFATAFTSITSFAQNIRDLRTAGCDIIIDDVIYFVESPFQDGAPGVTNTNGGTVIQAVVDVTNAGAMYFSSAGNEGNLNDGTASVWEGDFVDGGASPVGAITGGTVHNFGAGNLNNQITTAGARALLFWSDPLGASTNDYDLFTLNAAGTAVAASSTNIQNGTQDPVEDGGNRTTNQRLVILKKTGASARFLHLTCFGAEMAFVTTGTTHGHNSAPLAFGCAATPAADAFCAGFTDGPFPGPFTTANKVECFSSDGPRRVFYQGNGTAFTPGNVSSTGGQLRQKPDVTAADGTAVTGVGGFPNPFYGTSAAAPHAGAIAALVKSVNLSFTPAQIRTFLNASALDIEAAGVDRDSGVGIIMAFEAVQAAGGAPVPVIVSAGATLVSESCTPANGVLDPNENVTISFCVQNTGGVNTVNLVGTLQNTGGVTGASGPQNYGVVVAGGAAVCRNFTFTVNGTCGGTVTASIQFQDGANNLGTVTYTFTLGVQAVTFSENFDGVVAPALPAGWAATQGTNVTGAAPWVTSATTPDTAPNDAFSTCPNNVLDNRLDTPSIAITSAAAQVSFRNNWDFNDSGGNFDGGVLEVSSPNINAGAFTDITNAAVGGNFVQNGYNGTISVNFASPIAGRPAWSAHPNPSYVTTIANLGPNVNGQSIKLRFRAAADNSVLSNGWRIDTITVNGGTVCSTSCGGTPCVVTCPANITRSNDPNQCGAVVTYPAPTSSGTCGTITCTPASGSFFPVGTTTVTCTSSGGGTAPAAAVNGATLAVPEAKASSTSGGKVGANTGKGIAAGAKPTTSNRGSGSPASPPSSRPASPFAILYDQNNSPATFNVTSQNFEPANDAFDSEVADDFVVPAGVNWTVNQVFANGSYFNGTGPATSVNVVFYSDSSTLPGAAVATRNTSVIATDTAGDFLINISPDVVLAPGTYWVEVQANQNFTPSGQWGWDNRITAANSGAAFRNVGNGFGSGCTSFGRKTTCLPTQDGPDQLFQILGTSAPIGGGTGPSCTFTITVNDTQPPVITCPPNQTAVTPTVNDPCAVVNFTTTASDNCPGVTVVCNPPSGSCFPIGVTTVTCTATDASGNTATCSFTVSVFNGRLQDDFEACNDTVLFNTITGDYRWCCHGTIFTGKGKITRAGDTIRLEHIAADRRVRIDLSSGSFPPSGNGSIQSPPGTSRCVLQDHDTRDDTCVCGGPAPPGGKVQK